MFRIFLKTASVTILFAAVSFATDPLDTTLLSNDDFLSAILNKNIDFSIARIKGDTLTIVSTENEIYYPFGETGTFDQLSISATGNTVKYSSSCELPAIAYNNQYTDTITFVLSGQTNCYEILSSTVNSSKITVNNNSVGDHKNTLLGHYFRRDSGLVVSIFDRVNVITIESGLTGIWHHYAYNENGILTRIQFVTDYTCK